MSIFGLLLKGNLSLRPFKNSPIWSHRLKVAQMQPCEGIQIPGEVWLYSWPPVYFFGFSCLAIAKWTVLLVWSNPNQSNRRSATQWYFPPYSLAKLNSSVWHHFSILLLILQHFEKNLELEVVKFRDVRVGQKFETSAFHSSDYRFEIAVRCRSLQNIWCFVFIKLC